MYYFEEATAIVHLDALSGDEFYAAEFMKGLSHYKMDHSNKQIKLVQRIKGEDVNLPNQFKYVVDVSLAFFHQNIILALDA